MGATISQNGGTIYFRQENNVTQFLSDDSTSWMDVTGVQFPIVIKNTTTNVLTVRFTTDMVFTVDQYFICRSQYITFDGLKGDGNRATITFNGVSNCPGLIRNGKDDQNGYSNITVQNIHVASSGTTTLADKAGWVCQQFFGKGSSNVLIDNCSSEGSISLYAGGICGIEAGSYTGALTISNCYSTGQISGSRSGGICGIGLGAYSGNVEITNCYSTGRIRGSSAGGICGGAAGYIPLFGSNTAGTVEITNCYSTGQISGDFSGGICGESAGFGGGVITITNCYSLGEIIGNSAGGICGHNAGIFKGTVDISNCYSLYATGDTTIGTGGMVGSGTVLITNSYGANGTWSSDEANNQKLTGTPTEQTNPGDTWGYHVLNTPYYLKANPTPPPIPPTFEEMIESDEQFNDIIEAYPATKAFVSTIKTLEYVLNNQYWDTIEITGDITGMSQHSLTNNAGKNILIIVTGLTNLTV